MSPSLSTTLTAKLLRTTADYLRMLNDMNIHTVEDLLLNLPRTHEDLSDMVTLSQVTLDEKMTLKGTIDAVRLVRTKTGKQLVMAQFIDSEGGSAEVIWFNQPHIKRMLSNGDEVVLTGKVVEKGISLQIVSPQFERSAERPLVHAGKLVAVYSQHENITSKWLRERVASLQDCIELLPETLPAEVLEEEDLPSRAEAIAALHFPNDSEDINRARERFGFEELYNMQCAALERKHDWQSARQDRLKIPLNADLIKEFFASLHFTPTDSQKIAIYEILRDLEKDVPMSRLLEGDVGSGKTLVAVAVMATVLQSGGQSALMVPTEVLARQHVDGIGRLLLTFHSFLTEKGLTTLRLPNIAFLTGSVPASEAKAIKQAVAAGTVDIVIGTHALLEESVQFNDLKLVIVDEQHRFGVLQRKRLQEKGGPHFLSMTATPIPRTLALTAYGDHDLSVLLEKPGNRKEISTKVVSPTDRALIERFIDQQIEEGRQVFVICPLITASESEDFSEVKSVEAEEVRLREAFPHRRIASLHGRMKSADKTDIMQQFKEKQADILVSTSVIEVGIDVPNSTIIVIEGAERFGLSQLHQFRGRVGRSDYQSHCFLCTTTPAQARSPRLKAMEKYSSGFHLAEVDLQLRGPGEIFGTRQSGLQEGVLPTLLRPELIFKARQAAEKAMGIQLSRSA